MLGYMSYTVKAFMPNTLQCYRCCVNGHVAEVCRREIPRCGKCAGGHGTEECVVSAGKVV
uniref:SJCHGC03015 protein n=1 Tax=Schistosoma japonicum TaxID=6182 RepID=Q5BT09_SCHJA|nr:SJCHGC03015 protein [Schistosoma japonicum]